MLCCDVAGRILFLVPPPVVVAFPPVIIAFEVCWEAVPFAGSCCEPVLSLLGLRYEVIGLEEVWLSRRLDDLRSCSILTLVD